MIGPWPLVEAVFDGYDAAPVGGLEKPFGLEPFIGNGRLDMAGRLNWCSLSRLGSGGIFSDHIENR